MMDFSSMHGDIQDLLGLISDIEDIKLRNLIYKKILELDKKLTKHDEELSEVVVEIERLRGDI